MGKMDANLMDGMSIFNYDVWMKSFNEEGIEPAFYQ